jgi:hypothetical protein
MKQHYGTGTDTGPRPSIDVSVDVGTNSKKVSYDLTVERFSLSDASSSSTSSLLSLIPENALVEKF